MDEWMNHSWAKCEVKVQISPLFFFFKFATLRSFNPSKKSNKSWFLILFLCFEHIKSSERCLRGHFLPCSLSFVGDQGLPVGDVAWDPRQAQLWQEPKMGPLCIARPPCFPSPPPPLHNLRREKNKSLLWGTFSCRQNLGSSRLWSHGSRPINSPALFLVCSEWISMETKAWRHRAALSSCFRHRWLITGAISCVRRVGVWSFGGRWAVWKLSCSPGGRE